MTASSSTTETRAPAGVGRARGAVAAVLWLGVWQLVATLVGQELVLASPVEVLAALVRALPETSFWATLGGTAARIAAGFALGVVLGSALAWLAASSAWADALTSPLVRVLRSVPAVSFIILVLLWSGPGALTVTVAAVMVLPVVFANVREGIDQVDPRLRELAQVYDLSRVRRGAAIVWPTVLPYLAAACRVGLGLAWKAGVSAEVIGLPAGSIGERLYEARLMLATADVLAWTVVVVAAAWATERLALLALDRLERVPSWGWSR